MIKPQSSTQTFPDLYFQFLSNTSTLGTKYPQLNCSLLFLLYLYLWGKMPTDSVVQGSNLTLLYRSLSLSPPTPSYPHYSSSLKTHASILSSTPLRFLSFTHWFSSDLWHFSLDSCNGHLCNFLASSLNHYHSKELLVIVNMTVFQLDWKRFEYS